MKVQLPLSSWTEQHLRTERLVFRRLVHQVTQSGMLTRIGPSEEWKSDEFLEVKTGEGLFKNNHQGRCPKKNIRRCR